MTVRLPLVVGFARAMELIITGRRIDALRRGRIGLVNEVVPRGDGAAQRAQAARRARSPRSRRGRSAATRRA